MFRLAICLETIFRFQNVACLSSGRLVKPALSCLDIIAEARAAFDVPLAAYQVSGEYSMIKVAAAAGLLDEEQVMMESLLSIRRAGADMILTYFAPEAARLLAGSA